MKNGGNATPPCRSQPINSCFTSRRVAVKCFLFPNWLSTVSKPSQEDKLSNESRWRTFCNERLFQRKRERENSELCYTMIKTLGSSLFLQSVPANLHANRLHIKKKSSFRYRERERDYVYLIVNVICSTCRLTILTS